MRHEMLTQRTFFAIMRITKRVCSVSIIFVTHVVPPLVCHMAHHMSEEVLSQCGVVQVLKLKKRACSS